MGQRKPRHGDGGDFSHSVPPINRAGPLPGENFACPSGGAAWRFHIHGWIDNSDCDGDRFAVTAALGIWMIPFLHKLKLRPDYFRHWPQLVQNKQGTPTMGD